MSGDIRAITLTQPWGWAMVHAGKCIENRSRKDGRLPDICSHRGPLLLHAAKGMPQKSYIRAAKFMVELGLADSDYVAPRSPYIAGLHRIPRREDIARGVIIGRCIAYGTIDPDGRIDIDPRHVDIAIAQAIGIDKRWWMGGWALLVRDVKPTKHIRCRGMLGRWRVPADVLAQLGDVS